MLPISLPTFPPVAQGAGNRGGAVSPSAPSSSGGGLLTLFPCSSVGSLPQETVFHELLQRESFPWASVLHARPFHGVQSFRDRLLQRGSPMGSQVLPANLLQCGLLSPWGHRSCQEPAPAWASHGVTASFGHIHLLWRGVLHGLQVDSAPPLTSMGAGAQPVPPWSAPRAAGESLLWHLEHLLPVPLH